MKAFSTAKSGFCTTFAAAHTSALNLAHLDTALLAVSIVLVPILLVPAT